MLVAISGPAFAQYQPIDVGGFQVQPTLNVGTIYNSNLNPGYGRKESGVGASLAGNVGGTWASGLHAISSSLSGSGQFYPSQTNGNSWSVAGAIGHRYDIMSDLVWTSQASLNWFTNTLQTQPNLTGFGSQPSYTQQTGSVSLRKDFIDVFVDTRLGLSAQQSAAGTNATSNSNGQNYTAAVRGGYKFSPALSAFVEPSGNWQRFSNSFNDQQGYRLIAGLSSDQISLFSGELYGGLAAQNYTGYGIKQDPQPTYGGSINWFPTRDLTFRVAVSQAYGLGGPIQNQSFSPLSVPRQGDPLNQPPNTPVLPGSPNTIPVSQDYFTYTGGQGRTTTVALGANYAANSYLTTFSTVSYQHQSYAGGGSAADLWTATAGLAYQAGKDWGVTLAYTYNNVDNSGSGVSYTRSLINAGLAARF